MENKMKDIVILKNLPSNLVEEAIVILKCNKKTKRYVMKSIEKDNCKVQENSGKPKDYIVKEAQMVISSFIANMENQKALKNTKKENKKLEKKYKIMQISTAIMFIALLINLF